MAMDIYFPRLCVSQAQMEEVDGVKGKYTEGLGLEEMAVFCEWEDVQSFCANAVSLPDRIMKKKFLFLFCSYFVACLGYTSSTKAWDRPFSDW